jgi:tetratricopeptide (TPR) repeat protein
MNWSLPIARIGETEVKLHVSFVLLVIYVVWRFGLENLRGALFAFLLLALLFACVALHELGHTLVARRFGIPVRSIVLWPLGGLAMLSRLPNRPMHDLLIAVAGPIVNVALVGVALLGTGGINALAAPAYINRGLIRVIHNEDSRALPDFERGIQLAPYLVQGFQNRGMIYHRANDYHRALEDYNQAAALEPHDPDIHGLRGDIYFRLGDSDRARENIDLALKYKPAAALIFDEMWLSLYLTSRLDWALFYYDRAAQLRPDDPLVYQGRRDAYRVNRENEHALIEYNRAIELASERAETYLGRGRAYLAHGDQDRAVADFRHVLELNTKPNVRRQAEAHLGELHAASPYNL